MNKQQRKTYSRRVSLLNRKFETKLFPGVKKAIDKEISSLIEHIESGKSVHSWFELTNPYLTKEIESLYKKVGVFHANRITKGLKLNEQKGFELMEVKGSGFNAEWVNYIINYFRMHLVENITFGTMETMREYFLPKISQAITEGKPFARIVDEIESSEFSRMQAARIVRTEVNSAANVGAMAASETYEYEQVKEWITAQDFRVRGHKPKEHGNHVSLDGQIIDVNEFFIDSRSGVRLLHPGDPKAIGSRRDKAATIINCRCTIAVFAKRDENDRLIPKRK